MKQEIKDGAAPVKATSAGADAPGPLYAPFRVHQHNDSRGWCVKDRAGQSIYAVGLQLDDEAAARQIFAALNAPSPEPAEAAPAGAELIRELVKYTSHVHGPVLCERAKHSDYPCTCGLDALLTKAAALSKVPR